MITDTNLFPFVLQIPARIYNESDALVIHRMTNTGTYTITNTVGRWLHQVMNPENYKTIQELRKDDIKYYIMFKNEEDAILFKLKYL